MMFGLTFGYPSFHVLSQQTIVSANHTDIKKQCLDCWHLREPYYKSLSVFRVPVPATISGRHVYASNSFPNFERRDVAVHYETSPIDLSNCVSYCITKAKPAKFVELLVGTNDVLRKIGCPATGQEYSVFAIRGSCISKDIFPTPLEIAILIEKCPGDFVFEIKDIIESIKFWSHHSLGKN